jgi:hypothetical protein
MEEGEGLGIGEGLINGGGGEFEGADPPPGQEPI